MKCRDGILIKATVESIEGVIEKYLKNGIVPISHIRTYTIFPAVDRKWNDFMLESIIYHFSNKYTIIQISKAITKCNAIIVKNELAGMSNEEIIIHILSNEDSISDLCTESEVLNYLHEKGYIARKKLKNLSEILNRIKKNKKNEEH